MNFLDDRERARLKIQHKKERDKRICDRIKAVLLADKGWTSQQIAETLVGSWIGKDYKATKIIRILRKP